MTAHLASIGPVGWAAIVVGSLIVFRLVSPSFRAARAFIDSCDPGDEAWLDAWEAANPAFGDRLDAAAVEQAAYDAVFRDIVFDEFPTERTRFEL